MHRECLTLFPYTGAGIGLLLAHQLAGALLREDLLTDTAHLVFETTTTPVSQQVSACDAWLPDLMKVQAWSSSGARCQTDITVATQLSVDR